MGSQRVLGSLAFAAVVTVMACRDPETVAPTVPEPRAQPIEIRFKRDGTPALPAPAAEDRDWKPASYEALAPPRGDGRPTFSNDWFSGHIPAWTKQLGHLKGRPNVRYLEVGVFEGQSLLWMFENVLTEETSTATAIDLFDFPGLEARFVENLDRAGVKDRVTVLKNYSNLALRPLAPDSYDVIYIDASHTAANVIRDAVLCWDLLKVDGILIFDDYGLRPRLPVALRPGAMIDAMITAFQHEAEVLDRGWQVILRRRASGCYDNCSPLGPYEYHWNYKQPELVGTGTLVDPRTHARVPLTRDERVIIESLLLAIPFGKTTPTVSPALWESSATQSLIRKLGL